MDNDLQLFVKQIAVEGISTDALIRLVENYFTTHEPTSRIAFPVPLHLYSYKGIIHYCIDISPSGRRRK